MASLFSKARNLARFALDGHGKLALQVLSRRMYGDTSSVGLRRDLSKPFQAPSANMKIVVRPLRPDDDLAFLHSGPEEEGYTRFTQLRMIKLNVPTCYVAIASNGDICFMQWLIPATENEKIQAIFGSLFPLLNSDEALLECTYTVPAYRGQGIMASAMAQIAEKGNQVGARWVLTFPGRDNERSIKGCVRAGFEPYILRTESLRMFHRSVKFVPVSGAVDLGLKVST
jgi:GNAT superfamily N-acetyltransferase